MNDLEHRDPHVDAGNPDPALGDAKSGDRIGRYLLLQRLGEGAYGVVWMAEQREPVRRRVAIKFIKLGMDTEKVLARFEHERQTLAKMDHPNIARIFDGGATPEGRSYFVMELVRGTKITEFCDRERLSMDERLNLFLEICSAVQHAHQKGIIHRDLKPSNILVTLQDGRPMPKVIDFGVAKATRDEEQSELTCFTLFEQMVGTPMYMAPEQVGLHRQDIDTRCDIYALGVLLYELLAGRPPFDPKSMLQAGNEAVRRWIREQEPPTPSMRLKSLDDETRLLVARQRQVGQQRLFQSLRGDLDWIVMKGMEKSRDRRYDTAKEMADDVRRHLDNETVYASPPSRVYRLGRFAKKHRIPCVAVAMVFVTLLSGGVAVTRQALKAQSEATRASAALDALRGNAPGLVSEARSVAARGDFDAALEKLSLVMRLVPDEAGYLVARGDLLQAQLRFADAATAYRAALDINPKNLLAKANAERSEALHEDVLEFGRPSPKRLAVLVAAMEEEGRSIAERASIARLAGNQGPILREFLLEKLESTWGLAASERVTIEPSGHLALDLASAKITDLEILQGLPLEALNLTSTAIEDLSPLEGMPLRSLKLAKTYVADLSPLKGMPLEFLDASHTPIVDFSPLSQMPSLIELHLTGTDISTLEVLLSLPELQRLNLQGCHNVDYDQRPVLSQLRSLTHVRHPSGGTSARPDAEEWEYETANWFWDRKVETYEPWILRRSEKYFEAHSSHYNAIEPESRSAVYPWH